MKNILLIILLIIFPLQYLWSQIHIESYSDKTFGTGERVEAEFRLLDPHLVNDINLNKLMGVAIDGKFLVFSSTPFIKNQNRDEFISQVELIFTADYKNEKDLIFKYEGQEIKIKLNGFKFDPKANQEKGKLEFLKTDLDLSSIQFWIPILIFILGLILFFFLMKFYLKYKKVKKKKDQWKRYFNEWSEAEKRTDLEKTWIQREIIKKKYENLIPVFNDYWAQLNKFQFKEEWSEEDFKIVKNSFNKMMDELKKYDGV
jgi:hypothetical protein